MKSSSTKIQNVQWDKKYYQLIPSKVIDIFKDLSELMTDIPGFNEDYLRQIISIVAHHARKDDHGRSPLKMAYMRQIVPQADQYIKALIDLGIIYRYGSYQAGVTAYQYGFDEEYGSQFVSVPLNNAKLERRIRKQQGRMKRHNSKKYPSQNEQLNHLSVATGYTQAITLAYGDNYESWNYAKAAAVKIINRDIYFSVDDTSGRFHHNAANGSRPLRPYFLIYGEPMAEVDVKNCQPYLTILILTNPVKAAPFAKDRKFALMLESLQITQTEDVIRYVSLVTKGTFYEYFADQYNIKKGAEITRDDAKNMMLKILFAKNLHQPRGREVFEQLFPEVARIFRLVRGDEKGTKFQNYKRFAILLQSIESHIVNDLVIKNRINKEHPGTIAVSIYDTVSTGIQTDKINEVSEIMTDEFEKYVGHAPRLSVKRASEPENTTTKEKKGGKGERGGGRKKEGNTMLESLQQDDIKKVREGLSLKKEKKTPPPGGTVGPRTRNSLSLLYSLGYTHKKINGSSIQVFQKAGYNGVLKVIDHGIIQRADLFKWLSERHKLIYKPDLGSWAELMSRTGGGEN